MGKFIAVMPLAVIAMLVISLIESTMILPCHLAHSGEPKAISRWFKAYAERPLGTQLLVSVVCSAAVVGLGWMAIPWHAGSLALGVLMLPLVFLTLVYPLYELAEFAHWVSHASNQLLARFIERCYLPTLRWSIHHPGLVVSLAVSAALMSFGLVTSGVTPYVVFPKADSNRIEATVAFPAGTPETVSDAASRKIEAAIRRLGDRYAAQGDEVIQTTLRSVGQVRSSTPIGPEGLSTGSHMAKVEVELVPSGERSVPSQTIVDAWREETEEIPGAETLTFGAPEMGPGGAAIEFKLLADKLHMEQLEEAIEKCKQKLSEYGGVVDIRDDSRPGKWEFQIKVKDKAKSLGITLSEIANTVRGSYYGEEVMRLQRGRHEVKLMVRYPPEERGSLANFEEIRVRTANGDEYPLTELAEVQVARGYSEINRIDQKRSVPSRPTCARKRRTPGIRSGISCASFMPGLLAEYPEVTVLWEGQAEQTNESVGSLIIGFVVALVAMFVLLTIEFRSYFQPLIIMFIIPFGVVGAIWGHAIMGLTITMFTLFGLVALTGVVVNDSIVLIDFINLRYRQGMPLFEALIDAGRRRFRPVMLTSVTTIAGLTPMLTETSFQAQFLIPLAATLVFGLLVATGLVLILIPTTFSICQRLFCGVSLHGKHPAMLDDSVREKLSHSLPGALQTQ